MRTKLNTAISPVWCVAYTRDEDSKAGAEQWCATFRGTKPDPMAVRDKTRCGKFVIMRSGSEVRLPTCPECLRRLKR